MAAAATVTVENNSLALSSIKGAKADAEKGYKRKRERTNKETNQYTHKKKKIGENHQLLLRLKQQGELYWLLGVGGNSRIYIYAQSNHWLSLSCL